MTATIHPADWPRNMSAEERQVWMREHVTKWVSDKRVEDALTAAELGNLSHTQKAVAYRSLLIIGSIRHCRSNARAEVRMPILLLITYLSDNAKGVCYLSISKMQELFTRSRQCIVDNILALERDGSIGVSRVDGMPSCYWPRIPPALAEMSPNPVWIVEALTGTPKMRIFGTPEEAIAAATENQSSAVDQSSKLDRYRSSGVDHTGQVEPRNRSSPAGEPVKSSTDSISSLNLCSSSHFVPSASVSATRGSKSDLRGKPFHKGADMLAALNPEAAARKAYAAANVSMSKSGRVAIGAEFREELLSEGFTAQHIDKAVVDAAAYANGADPEALMKRVRQACGWARKHDTDQAARAPRKSGITGRSGRPSL